MTFVFAAIAFGFSLIILITFSNHVVSAGGFYGYVSAGLGPLWGARADWLMVLTYWCQFFSPIHGSSFNPANGKLCFWTV